MAPGTSPIDLSRCVRHKTFAEFQEAIGRGEYETDELNALLDQVLGMYGDTSIEFTFLLVTVLLGLNDHLWQQQASLFGRYERVARERLEELVARYYPSSSHVE